MWGSLYTLRILNEQTICALQHILDYIYTYIYTSKKTDNAHNSNNNKQPETEVTKKEEEKQPTNVLRTIVRYMIFVFFIVPK